ncbi:MAG: type II secretion system F family protein [Candidatus Omnitrophica bacterium]|nr:type II secretion system F family protein [Candidatus Omnitrophota bacterium]
MPLFKYIAKKGPDEIVEDTIEAQSKDDAVRKINDWGYLATRIVEVAPGKEKAAAAAVSLSTARISGRDLTILTRQLAALLKSGVPILQSLQILSEQTEGRAQKAMLTDIAVGVREGKPFSAALQKYPRVFVPLYVSMVRAGEDSGNLHQMLFKVSDYREKQEQAVAKIRSALAYPALMFVTGVATIVFMLTFVLPRMTGIFTGMGQDLPLATRIVLKISTFMSDWWYAVLLGLAILTVLMRQMGRTHAQRKALSRLLLNLPLIGDFERWANLSRFSRTLELLIRSGIPVLQAISLSLPVLQNEVIKEELARCHQKLEGGGSLGQSLKQGKVFPPFMTNLVAVGEESGRLDEVLAEIASVYERDVEEALKVMTTLFEPLMILLMGGVVGFIVVAMLLPVFEMNMMVR